MKVAQRRAIVVTLAVGSDDSVIETVRSNRISRATVEDSTAYSRSVYKTWVECASGTHSCVRRDMEHRT